MTDAERAALIEKAARAIWHAMPGAEVWETLDEDDWNRELCLSEAYAALSAVGFFSPAQVGASVPSKQVISEVERAFRERDAYQYAIGAVRGLLYVNEIRGAIYSKLNETGQELARYVDAIASDALDLPRVFPPAPPSTESQTSKGKEPENV